MISIHSKTNILHSKDKKLPKAAVSYFHTTVKKTGDPLEYKVLTYKEWNLVH